MVYLDYAATTPLNKRVKEAMIKAMDYYGNPSSNYTLANNSNQILEDCRKELTKYLNGSDGDFIFTSGGSEANTQAITKTFPDAILYNPTEHDSTILAIQSLEYSSRLNVKTLQIPINPDGTVNVSKYKDMLDNCSEINNIFVTVMMVNNETGALNNIKELAKIAHEHFARFHCDMVQALPHCKIDLEDLDVDYASFSAHKIGGPKGVGALWIRHGCTIGSLIEGGKQEYSLRGGTQNVIGIAGFAEAIRVLKEQSVLDMEERNSGYREYLFNKLKEAGIEFIPNTPANRSSRTDGIVNISIPKLHGDATVIALDEFSKVFVSTASACSTSGISYVLQKMGLSSDRVASALRISFGAETTQKDIDTFVDALAKVYNVFGKTKVFEENY